MSLPDPWGLMGDMVVDTYPNKPARRSPGGGMGTERVLAETRKGAATGLQRRSPGRFGDTGASFLVRCWLVSAKANEIQFITTRGCGLCRPCNTVKGKARPPRRGSVTRLMRRPLDTELVDSLKALDPERPIREADMFNALTNVRFWGQSGH
jgi:hypothetical protein